MVFFGRRSIAFHSPLSIDQCAMGLLDILDKSYWYGSCPVIGTIHQNKIDLRRRHSYFYISTLPVFSFHGTLREDATGTMIEGRFSMNLAMKIFITTWIILVIPFAYVSGAHIHSIIFTLFIAGVIGGGQLLGRQDKRYLQDFLTRTLKARRTISIDLHD